MPAARLSRRRRSSHGLGLFTPAKPGTYTIPPRPVTFAPNVTPITYTAPDTDDDDILLALSTGASLSASLSLSSSLSPNSTLSTSTSTPNSHPNMPTATLFPPSLTPAPPPTRKRCPPGKRRSQGYIPRPPNAFMLFRADFVRQKHVPGTIETNHGSLSKIIGTCWRQLPLDEKRVWEIKAKHEKAAHKLMFPDYRFRPVHNKNKNSTTSGSTSSSTTKNTSSTSNSSSTANSGPNSGSHNTSRTNRNAPEPPNPEDERRCEEVAALLLEGKKGAELTEAVKRLDERRERERELLRSYEGAGYDERPYDEGAYDPEYDGSYDPAYEGGGYDAPPPAYSEAYPASATSSALSLPPSSRASPASASVGGPVLHMPLPMHTSVHPQAQFAGMHNQAQFNMPAQTQPQFNMGGGMYHNPLPQSMGAYHRRSSSVPPLLPSNDFFFGAAQPQSFAPMQGGQQQQGGGGVIALPEVPFMGTFAHGRGSFSFGPSARASFSFAPQPQSQGQQHQQYTSFQEHAPTQNQFTNPFSNDNTYLFSIHPSPSQRNSLGLSQRRASSAQALLQSWTYDASFSSGYYDHTGGHGMGGGQGMMERDHSPLPDVPAELFSDFSFSTSSTTSSSTTSSSTTSTSLSSSAHPSSHPDPVSALASPRAPLSSTSTSTSGSTTAGSAYDGSPLPGMPAPLGPTDMGPGMGLGLGMDLGYMNLDMGVGMGVEAMYGASPDMYAHAHAHVEGPMDVEGVDHDAGMYVHVHVHAPKPQQAQHQAQVQQAMWDAGGQDEAAFFEGGVFDV